MTDLSGCAPARVPRIEAGFCAPPFEDTSTQAMSDPLPGPGASRLERAAALLGLASTMGERAQGRLSLESSLIVVQRLEIARAATAAVVAEIDCESERLSQAADYLAERKASNAQVLTVSSIVTAAATAVAGVLLSTAEASGTAQNVVVVTGSSATAGLGIAALFVDPKVRVERPRPLLLDVWRGPPRSRIYPALIWAYLNDRGFSNAQESSIRQNIVRRWRQIGPAARAIERLVFAEGAFNDDELRTISAMLDQVKAEVALLNQDLEMLARYLLAR